MQSKTRFLLVPALLVTALLGVSAMTGCAAKTTAGASVQAIPVQTAAAQVGDVSSVNALAGNVTANIQTDVSATISGQVQAVCVDVGDHVTAGQALAQLGTVDLEKQLAQLQAQIQIDQDQIPNAQATYDQDVANQKNDQILYNSGSLSETTLNNSQLTVDADQAKLQTDEDTLAKDQATAAITQQQMAEMTITAPVDGIVSARDIEVGEEVSAQTTCFSIAQISSLFVTVNVSEQNITGVNPGTTARISVPDIGTAVFQGTVTNVSPTLDTTSQAYPVKIQIQNPDPKILPGMTASVQFTGLKTQPGIIIPVQAIEETPQGSEVFTVANNVAHLHMIQIGATSSEEAVVTSGLQAGEQVVITGQDLLSDNTKVTVVQNTAQAGVQGMVGQIKHGSGAKKKAAGTVQGAAQ